MAIESHSAPCHAPSVPIPAFNEHGCLPEGVHDCDLAEIKLRFGSFQGSDRRAQLFAKLESFMAEAMAAGLVRTVLVDGSFVTAKPEPNDIDLILVVPANHDFAADLPPTEYGILSKRRVHRRYGLDLLVASADSAAPKAY